MLRIYEKLFVTRQYSKALNYATYLKDLQTKALVEVSIKGQKHFASKLIQELSWSEVDTVVALTVSALC